MLTIQEMFDRAWNGLKAQGFQRAYLLGAGCSYFDDSGRRCAWGHVDPEGTRFAMNASVNTLKLRGIGLAVQLEGLDPKGDGCFDALAGSPLAFASDLQNAHDQAEEPMLMERNLRGLAERYRLTVPE